MKQIESTYSTQFDPVKNDMTVEGLGLGTKKNLNNYYLGKIGTQVKTVIKDITWF